MFSQVCYLYLVRKLCTARNTLMALPTATQLRGHDHPSRFVQPRDDVRRRALARLYERRSAVDKMIGALERYQQEQSRLSAKRAAITAAEMLS